jgi:hypothetical protein
VLSSSFFKEFDPLLFDLNVGALKAEFAALSFHGGGIE